MKNEQLPLISVIIPCYKQAHLLSEAIESVLQQTYQNFEIIVVDDGSPDNTSEVAARYPEVKCVRQDNQGLAAARNTGLRESNADFVVFLDSDDRLLPHALKIGLDDLGAHPECAFVCGHANFITFDGSPHPYTQRPCIEMSYAFLLERNEIVSPMVVMFRREVLESANGFTSSLKASEDYDIYLRIAQKFLVHCHHEVIAEYRQHPSSMSQNYELMLKSTLTVLHAQREHVKGNKEYEAAYACGVKFYRQYYGERIVNQVREQVRQRESWRQALHNIGVLLRHYPQGIAENIGRKLRGTVFGTAR